MKQITALLNQLGEWGPFRAVAEHIRTKMLVSLLALALIPLIISGLMAFNAASDSLNEQAFAQLESLRTNKTIALENYLAERQANMSVLVDMVSALRDQSFAKMGAIEERKAREIENFFVDRIGDVRFARNLVVVKGTTGLNEGLPVLAKYKNDQSNPAYKEAFERAENVLGAFSEERGNIYADIMLVDLQGDIVFALDEVSRGGYEGDSVEFQNGLEDVYIGDIVYVKPHDDYDQRITAPVLDNRGKTIGVIFLEINIERIDAIMNDRIGLGQTGETYLVGKVGDQNELRSNRVVKTGRVGDPKPGPDGDKALAGLAGQQFKIGSTGAYELSVYRPLDIPNRNWAIIATASVVELLIPAGEGAEQDVFTNYIERHGYYDLFLFEPDGYLFYTVLHEPDYQTNLLTGPYKTTNLGHLLAEILETKRFELSDYERYAPSQDAPAAFIAQPLLNAAGEVELVVALQLPLDQINALMLERTGLGQTGETYLVGQDGLWRSDSRFLDQLGTDSTILNEEFHVDTVAARSALASQSGTQLIDDYRGVPVLSSWSSISFEEAGLENLDNPEGLRWAVIAEIDQAEVQQPVVNLAWSVGGLIAGAAVLVVIASALLSGGLTRQILAIAEVFTNIAQGDLVGRAEITSRDELGRVSAGLNLLLDRLVEMIQTTEIERTTLQLSVLKLLEEISGVAEGDLTLEAEVTAEATGALADSFNFMIGQMRQIIGDIQQATGQVSSSAGQIRATTETLSRGSESQAAQILDTSSAVDEMSVSIQQVSENATVSATVAQQALTNARQGARAVRDTIEGMDRIREQVQSTAKRIKRLGESSQEIGEIVQLIRDIAKRTMVLALNASLEAAAAGEAGRGFAVVAEDVKRLADRATNATLQITELIKTTQQETNAAVAAMEESTREVVEGSQLADQAGQALAEIESVSERLAELSQSISEAAIQQARGSEAVSYSMSEIAEITQQTAAGTQQAAVSISQLATLADDLRGSVSAFKLSKENGHNGREEIATVERVTASENGGTTGAQVIDEV